MGQLLYGTSPTPFEVDDRALAHLEMVILAKLRRNEGFAMSFATATGGRESIWLSPNAELRFVFYAQRSVINREWLDRLVDAANSPSGLTLLPEGD